MLYPINLKKDRIRGDFYMNLQINAKNEDLLK